MWNMVTSGSTAPLLSVTLVRTVSFSLYQKTKYLFSDWIEKATGSSPLVAINTSGSHPTLSTLACFGAAGATSGGVITTIACKLAPRTTSGHQTDGIT